MRDPSDAHGVEDDLKKIKHLCIETGHEYVRTGLSHLPNLPKLWSDLGESQESV